MAGIYVHIPFCRSKCAYCDFYSTPRADCADRYIDALGTELDLRITELNENIETLYIGGGTPSILSDSQLKKLFSLIEPHADVSKMTEITIEANPEDITPQQLEFYSSLGINRVSIGIQSFDDGELEAISRKHSSADSQKALAVLQNSGFNYNADLIYGLPGQSLTDWTGNLKRLLQFKPPHLSAYLLSYEPGTKLYARLAAGKISEATEELALQMYNTLCRLTAEAGYNHYEVSNFALPGYEARHNSSYWTYVPYLGIGVAAHSFDGKTRRYNNRNLNEYLLKITKGETACYTDSETDANRFNDYIITSLRTSWGFSSSLARTLFGNELPDEFMKNLKHLQPGLIKENNGCYIIPECHWLTSDAIMRELIIDIDYYD